MMKELQWYALELKQKERVKEENFFELMLKQMKVEPMFNSMLENMKEEKLVEALFSVSKNKRYLVVLDDVWKHEAWDSLKHAFPAKGKKGSKVLLTIRNKEVASYADPWSSPVEPALLSNDEAWELLSRKAFPKDVLIRRGYRQEHEKLGREMVKKCGGLPLAIFVLGGFLATKKTAKELCISSIDKRRGRTVEDVGEQYLEELVNRCIVQVSQRDHTGIGIKTFRIHDLMRDMCVLMAREENFLGISEHYRQNIVTRRIAVHPQISPEYARLYSVPLLQCNPPLRSVLYFKEQRYELTIDYRTLTFNDSRLLRVLNFGGLNVEYVPKEIGDLIHLRHLVLRNAKVTREAALPTSIGKLRSLHTLDVQGIQSLILPNVVWKLEDLRHLLIDLPNVLEQCRMETLRNLENLRWAHCENLIRKNAMQNLTNLRNLAVNFKRSKEISAVTKSPIFSTGRLRSLNIRGKQSSFPNLEPLSYCESLTKLELHGIIPEDPHPSITTWNIYQQVLPS
ncbi:hypothetical protein GH714_036307 [Hevea brasiliensis]|uniref:Uncharacterized protein n=1 Tax=Hevea brasiliensis TaxID=3981 RepID=A0A6A6L6R2_HEVBR|nr:hypothetical protein GH714_036307 [Hevea brasiliensis]